MSSSSISNWSDEARPPFARPDPGSATRTPVLGNGARQFEAMKRGSRRTVGQRGASQPTRRGREAGRGGGGGGPAPPRKIGLLATPRIDARAIPERSARRRYVAGTPEDGPCLTCNLGVTGSSPVVGSTSIDWVLREHPRKILESSHGIGADRSQDDGGGSCVMTGGNPRPHLVRCSRQRERPDPLVGDARCELG